MMRTLAITLLVLLVSTFSSTSEYETVAVPVEQSSTTSANFSMLTGKPDYVATETVEASIPVPARVMRYKLGERSLRLNYGGLDSTLGIPAKLAKFYHTKSVTSLLAKGCVAATPIHDSDYLKFGILVI